MSTSISTAQVRVGRASQSIKADVTTKPRGGNATESVTIDAGDITYRIVVTESGALHISSESLDFTSLSVTPDTTNRILVQAVQGANF